LFLNIEVIAQDQRNLDESILPLKNSKRKRFATLCITFFNNILPFVMYKNIEQFLVIRTFPSYFNTDTSVVIYERVTNQILNSDAIAAADANTNSSSEHVGRPKKNDKEVIRIQISCREKKI
jgi:hypothetical protein